MILDISDEELEELYVFIQTLLGATDVEVDITKKEICTLTKKALKDHLYVIHQWQIRNQFSNIMGTRSSRDFTNRFVQDNMMLAQRISDWFAAMARVGGKIPWKKDYIVLEGNKQVYDLSVDSAIPYVTGTRRIHRVMWYAKPEIFGTQQLTPDFIDNSLFAFGPGGLSYGANTLGYLGNMMDVVLLAQSLETRNKILRSEFFYNISGDIVELTPMPGGQSLQIIPDSRVYYYYMDEEDFLGLPDQEQGASNELITNPSQVQINRIPYSNLNDMSKNWIDNYTVALAKYVQGSKWRVVKKIASPGSDYEIEFSFETLLEESKTEIADLKEELTTYLAGMDIVKMFEDKATISDAASKVNNKSPRRFFIG